MEYDVRSMLEKSADILDQIHTTVDVPEHIHVFFGMLLYRYLRCLREVRPEGEIRLGIDEAELVLNDISTIALRALKKRRANEGK